VKVWSEVHPGSGGDFVFQPGERYAVLASVSRNYSLAEVQSKAQGKGFTLTYSWEQGQPERGQYHIDSWLASLPADATSNHRWLYAEGNFSDQAQAWTVGQDPPWPFTVYHLADVFHAVDAPDQTSEVLPATVQSAPAPSSGALPALVIVFSIVAAAGLGYWAGAAEVLPRLGWRT
jgi:hypothetical protein